jgi:membrane protein implicated in regulation of membrane protease activity
MLEETQLRVPDYVPIVKWRLYARMGISLIMLGITGYVIAVGILAVGFSGKSIRITELAHWLFWIVFLAFFPFSALNIIATYRLLKKRTSRDLRRATLMSRSFNGLCITLFGGGLVYTFFFVNFSVP